MTNRGKFFPATRHGMDRFIVGPFAKCSFEEILINFIIAASKREVDNLQGISSRVILGLEGLMGTNVTIVDKTDDKQKIMICVKNPPTKTVHWGKIKNNGKLCENNL